MKYGDATILEKLGYDMMGISVLINYKIYFYVLLSIYQFYTNNG